MPFRLNNAGATNQRTMVALFHDMIHHEIEVYAKESSETPEEQGIRMNHPLHTKSLPYET